MCGIAGFVPRVALLAREAQAIVDRMLDAQRTRGPDDRGVVVVGTAASASVLGNVRLAILDPSPAGHQPMRYPETGDWIVLNGEIYNHREVRRSLPGPFRSGSDTETVLHAYGAWGERCLERLRGMFAFALWDERRRALWCVRDRLGI